MIIYLCNQSGKNSHIKKIQLPKNSLFRQTSLKNSASFADAQQSNWAIKKNKFLRNLHILKKICKKIQVLSIISKRTANLCNQPEKSYIFKESSTRKFHTSKINHGKVEVLQIYVKTVLSWINEIK